MNKLVVENLIIDKSDKDIALGVNYEFSDGINLICGRNEAGKSSLMRFIKDALFKEKGIDTGKIFFSICDFKYRADVKDSKSTDQRCKLYDSNNNVVSYDIVEKNITKNDFKQGFTISLDELMSLQGKDTENIIEMIKDPSGKKLKDYLDKTRNLAKKTLGDNGRLTKEVTSVLEKISILNTKINELSNNETNYNSAINSLNSLTEELEIIREKEEYVNLSLKIKKLLEELSSLEDNYQHLYVNYNDKFFNEKELYLELVQNAGKYETDIGILEKNAKKLDALNLKINADLNRLKSDYFVNLSIEELNGIEIDFEKIKKIKDSITEIESMEKDLIGSFANKENIEENLLKLKCELSKFDEKLKELSTIDDLKKLHTFVDDGLKQHDYLCRKISETEQNTKINYGGIISNRNLLILMGAIFVFTIISAVLSFVQKVPMAGIFSILMAILTSIGFASLKIASYKDKQDAEIERVEQLKNNILVDLKEKLKNYYSEIENVESSYLPFKIDTIKQEISNKIQQLSNIDDLYTKNKSDTDFYNEKLNSVVSKIQDIENRKLSIIQENKSIMDSSISSNLKEQDYIDVIEIVKTLKDDLVEKYSIEEENAQVSKESSEIIEKFKKFVLDSSIDVPFSGSFADNIVQLKLYSEKNLQIKNQLDILNVDIQNRKNQIAKLNSEKEKYSFDISSDEDVLNELQILKKEKMNLKKDAEFVKRELEGFEGLEDLKIQKSILQNEYESKISELIKNKMILSLCEKAKRNFDRTQPDLKNAQKYLSILTDGKYTKINLDLQEIQNDDSTKTKNWDNLSRGTKELLYLALRLGFASNYSKDKVTLEPNGKPDLPIIIDDAFVNFDSQRTKNAIKCLVEFSKTNQVLFFTCHTEVMKKYFEELCENYKVINL